MSSVSSVTFRGWKNGLGCLLLCLVAATHFACDGNFGRTYQDIDTLEDQVSGTTKHNDCDQIDKKKHCQKVDSCTWNKDLDLCHADDDCQYFNHKKDCQKVDGCTWNKCLDLCHADDDCSYYNSKKDCLEVDGCNWDKDQGLCHADDDEDLPPLESCADNPSFVDADGYSCEDWVGYDCHEAVLEWGYCEAEVADLLRNCPQSCELCAICTDTADYVDADGYSCEDWVGYDCQAAVEDWDYSEDEEEELIKNCPQSCELCAICTDTADYVDADGYSCEDWVGYDCFSAVEDWDYSEDEEEELIKNCPQSCELCAICTDSADYVDADGYSCEDWVGYDCQAAVEDWDYSEDEEEELIKNCPQSCELCAICTDTADYVDADGYSCEDWVGYDCFSAIEVWDYSPAQEADLIRNCPESCELCPD